MICGLQCELLTIKKRLSIQHYRKKQPEIFLPVNKSPLIFQNCACLKWELKIIIQANHLALSGSLRNRRARLFIIGMKKPAAETAGYLNVRNCFFYIRSLTPRQADGDCAHYSFQWITDHMGGTKMVPDDLAGLRKLYLGFISSRVILTANNLKIFDSLEKASSAAEIARKLKIDPRATEILLDAFTGERKD